MKDEHILIKCRQIIVEQNSSFEKLAYQLQQNCDKIIAIINGTRLRYYDSLEDIPKTLQFESKVLEEYYFKDRKDGHTYCFFRNIISDDRFTNSLTLNTIQPVKDKFILRDKNTIYEFTNMSRLMLCKRIT